MAARSENMSERENEIGAELLAMVARHSSNAVVILNREDRIVWVNDAYETLTGWAPDEVIGKAPWEFLNSPDTNSAAIERLAIASRDGKSAYEIIQNQHRDGHLIWMRIEKEPVIKPDGSIDYFISIERDITDTVEQARAHKISDQMFRDAIESLADGFVIYDSEDRLVTCNQRYKQIYHTSADLLIPGHTFSDIIRRGVARGQYSEAADDPEGWTNERIRRHQNPDGEPVEHQLDNGRWIQIREHKTEFGSIVGIRTDVTELKKAQLASESANKAKTEFLAHMSHELRSPLNAILGYAELCLTDPSIGELPPVARQYVDTIRSSGQHLLGLIGDILDLSKIEADQLVLEETCFNIRHAIEEIVSVMLLPAKENANQLELEEPADLHEWLLGDPVRIKQILMNFISNAVKFTRDGTIQVAIEILADEADSQHLRFSITDDGIGIPEEKQDQLFEAFTQAEETTTREYGGTGLGLAISKKLATAMDGEIGVTSSPGEGSCFWFATRFRKTEAPKEKDQSDQLVDLQSLRLLLVEDIKLNRIMAQRMLENAGHQVLTAEDGMKAIEAVKAHSFDAILMDIHMPKMDGIEATRHIKALEDPEKSSIPIVALTADIASSNIQEYLAVGMSHYCSKPINIKTLSHILLKVAKHQGKRDQKAEIPETPISSQPTAIQAKPAANLVDENRFLEVQQHIPDCLPLFQQQMTEALADMQSDEALGDFAKIRIHAHAVKGTAGNLGFSELHELSAKLEESTQSDDIEPAQVNSQITKLAKLAEETLLQADKILSSHSRTS